MLTFCEIEVEPHEDEVGRHHSVLSCMISGAQYERRIAWQSTYECGSKDGINAEGYRKVQFNVWNRASLGTHDVSRPLRTLIRMSRNGRCGVCLTSCNGICNEGIDQCDCAW